ncbi:MAG: hypothetical protein HYV01_18810 [Deltaproteobacteria bacterium]|nr:hypothetical protein [Deltaproteobacteria bacterium]
MLRLRLSLLLFAFGTLFKVALDLLGKDRPANASTNPRDYVDGSLMQELIKSGFAENLYC